MNPLRTAASALLCTLALVSQQAAAVEYQLPAANSRLIGENQGTWYPRTTVRWSRSPPTSSWV